MNKNLRRSAAALATAFACLALMSSPASANASHTATITSGTVDIVRTDLTTESIPLGTSGTGTTTPCPATLSSTVITHAALTAPLESVDVTTFVSRGRFTLGTGTYIADLTRISSTPGTFNTSTLAIASAGLVIRADIYPDATNCVLGTRICRFNNVSLSFSGSASASPLATGVTATLSSTTTTLVTSPPCTAVFTSLNGGTVTVNNMVLTLTS